MMEKGGKLVLDLAVVVVGVIIALKINEAMNKATVAKPMQVASTATPTA